MSDLRDLVEKDLSRVLPKNRELSKKYLRMAKAFLGRDTYYVDQLESALRHYEAAFRADTSNNEAIQAFELFKNYRDGVKTLLNDRTHVSLAVEYFKKVVSIDPNFRSTANMLRTAAVLCDDWETISHVGILTASDASPSSKAIEQLEQGDKFPYVRGLDCSGEYPAVCNLVKKYLKPVVESRRRFRKVLTESFYEPSCDRGESAQHPLVSRKDWSHWLEIWFIRGDTHKSSFSDVTRPYKAHNGYDDALGRWFELKHIGKCSLKKPRKRLSSLRDLDAPGKLRKAFESYEAEIYTVENTYPVLVTVWEVPFQVEMVHTFKKHEDVWSEGLIESFFDVPTEIGYEAEIKFKTKWGKARILSTPTAPVIDFRLDEMTASYHDFKIKWYCR